MHQLAEGIERVLAAGEDGCRYPEAELISGNEWGDADEGKQGSKVVEGVLDRRAGEAPPVLSMNVARCEEGLRGSVADSVGYYRGKYVSEMRDSYP